jgi:Na+/melibiose symporter-like transporter
VGLGFAVIMIFSIWTTFWGVTEKNNNVPDGSDPSEKATPLSYARTIIYELKHSRPFRLTVLILLFGNCAATIQAANLPYYLQYVLDMEAARPKILMTLFVSAIISVPIWVTLAKRFGKAETYRSVMLVYAAILCGTPLVGPEIGTTIFPLAALIGFAYGAAITLPWAMVPDVVEYDEYHRGS